MTDFYKRSYEIFDSLKNTSSQTRNILVIAVLCILLFVYFHLGTIVWWGLLMILAYYVYSNRKTSLKTFDNDIDILCKDKESLPLCQAFYESRKKHNQLIETIKNRIL